MVQDIHNSIAAPAGWRNSPLLWVIAVGLFANAAAMVYNHQNSRFPDFIAAKAYADAAPADHMLGARGIYMMPAQLGPNSWGLYIMDVDSETVCMYRADPDNARFRLVSARTFKNDRFLEDYNNQTPTPRDVEKWVQQEREHQQIENTGASTDK